MSEFDLTEDLEPDDSPDEEEYEPDEPDLVVSPETGTVYYEEGAAEATPHDLAVDEDEDEDEE
jgi:hypothetical protein